MIATAKTKPRPFDVILVWKFSRFARNQDESAFYKSILRKKCNIDVVSITEPISEGMYGRLIEMIIEWNDEFYSYNLSQEVTRGMQEKAIKGGYQTSPPLGYKAVGEGKPFVIDEETYKIYQYIADLYDFEHLDATGIARRCNDLGYRTQRGNLFEARTIRRLMKNQFYAGTVSWNGISFEGSHEVRISKERFDARMEWMNANRKQHKQHDVSGCKHWLSGVVKCSICGASLGYCSSSSVPFFQCWKYGKGFHKGSCSISEAKLIRMIKSNFEEIMNGRDFVCEYLPALPITNERNTEADRYRKELEKLQQREERVRLAFENGIDSMEEYAESKKRIREERERLQGKILSLELPKKKPTKKDMFIKIGTAYDVIFNQDSTYQEKGTMIRSIVKEIIFDKEEQKLTFVFYQA